MIYIVVRGIMIVSSVIAIPVLGMVALNAPQEDYQPQPIRVVVEPAEVMTELTPQPTAESFAPDEVTDDSQGQILDKAYFIDKSLKTD
jgi:hypothetical protein